MRGELVQTINIPEDCTAIRVGRTIEIRKKVNPQKAKYHCGDCEYLIEGYPTNKAWYKTDVCKLKPKPSHRIASNGEVEKVYYSCSIWSKICENFKQK